MRKRIRKHIKQAQAFVRPKQKQETHPQKSNFPLNSSQSDRISFSVLRNNENEIVKIENVSFEINIQDKWEWIVRFDDHGGTGPIHRHVRVSLTDPRVIESSDNIKSSFINKNYQLNWICNEDIKKNYLTYKRKFLKASNRLDLY